MPNFGNFFSKKILPKEVAAASAARGRERGSLTSAGVEVFDSVRTHYRLRARFDVLPDFRDPDGRRLAYVMWNQPPPKPRALVEDFPIASAAINALMPRLLRACEAHAVLRSGLASAFFHSTLKGDMAVVLTYGAGGPEAEEAWAAAAREHLAEALGVPVVGRARKVCVVLERNH